MKIIEYFLEPATRFKKIYQNKFVKNVAIVATGTAGAQAITMLFAPIITRLYGPEAYGLLGIFMAVLAILTPVAALSYPIAIVLPKEDSDAKGMAKLAFYIAVGMAGIIGLILLISNDLFLRLWGAQSISSYSFLIPFSVFFAALFQIAHQWMIRKKLFKITAKVAVYQSLILNVAKAGIGFFNPVAGVLIIITTIGSALQALMLWLGVKKHDNNFKSENEETPVSPALKQLARQYYDFPVYRTPQILINAISQNLPILMLANFFSAEAVGFYTLAKTVLGKPAQLIGNSVVEVFYPHITDAFHNKKNVTSIISKATLLLALVGFVPFGFIVAFGPWFFGFVFGSDWTIAGEYARWLTLWLYFAFLNRPSVAAIATLSLQGFFLIYEIISVVLRIASLLVGFLVFNNDVIAIAMFSIAGAFLNIALIGVTIYKSKHIARIAS